MTNKFKIDKWDVYVGIFLALLAIVWLHSECNRTTESTATTSTSTTSSPTRPDFISVSLEDYPNWGNFRDNTRLEGTLYQVWGVTLNIPDSLWVESEKSYPYLLLFLRGEKVVKILPVRSYRELPDEEVKRQTDSTVTTASGTYWKPRYCIEEGSKYSVTDSYVVSVEPVNEKAKTPHSYWWWVGVIAVGAGLIAGILVFIAGIGDGDGGLIFGSLVVETLLGWAMSVLL